MEGKCTYYTKNVQGGNFPFINLQFIVYSRPPCNDHIQVYFFFFFLIIWLVLNSEWFIWNLEAIRLKIISHIDNMVRIHDIGDRCGINVHPEVTLTWQVSDI